MEDEIGFRTIETRGSTILLNGKPIFLRGVSMHEEAPFRGGRAFSPEDAQALLGWAKELGCNFVRLAHYPHNENEIRLADRLGLLVWSEIPVYWVVDWENPATLQIAEDQLRENIARDHNRASVILWSLSNETPITPARTEFIKKLAAFARQDDSTRLLTSAMNQPQIAAPDSRLLNDPLCEFLDVLGINEYIGWYEGRPEDAARTHWSTSLDKPLIFSEFGAGALYGNHGDPDARFTEEYQSRVFEQQLLMLKQIPNLAGMSPWVLMDFRSPRRMLTGIQDYRNRKGLVSDQGQRKQAFYVLQKFYAEKAKENQ
jgi:beta-glucuronidase